MSFARFLTGAAIGTYLLLIRPTLRVRRIGHVPRIEPVLYAALHGDQATLLGSHPRGFAALASDSRDGALAAQVLRILGHTVRRGSSSGGGVGGFFGLRTLLRAGQSAVVTVDGPRGPRAQASPGAAVLAASSGAVLVPVVTACRPRIRLPTWDGFEVPLPFSRVLVVYGRPVNLAGSHAALSRRTSWALSRLDRRAERVLGR